MEELTKLLELLSPSERKEILKNLAQSKLMTSEDKEEIISALQGENSDESIKADIIRLGNSF